MTPAIRQVKNQAGLPGGHITGTRYFVCALLVLIAACTLAPGTFRGLVWSVSGQVRDSTNTSPLPGCVVLLTDYAHHHYVRTRTDANGKYFFNNLRRGKYALGFCLNRQSGVPVFEIHVKDADAVIFDYIWGSEKRQRPFPLLAVPRPIQEDIVDSLKESH